MNATNFEELMHERKHETDVKKKTNDNKRLSYAKKTLKKLSKEGNESAPPCNNDKITSTTTTAFTTR